MFQSKNTKMFVSKHVMFDENMFPYKKKESLSPSNVCITDFLNSLLPTSTSQTSPTTTIDLMQIPISIVPKHANSYMPHESPSNHDNDHTSQHATLDFSSQAHDMTFVSSHTIVDNNLVSDNSMSENSDYSSHLSE